MYSYLVLRLLFIYIILHHTLFMLYYYVVIYNITCRLNIITCKKEFIKLGKGHDRYIVSSMVIITAKILFVKL